MAKAPGLVSEVMAKVAADMKRDSMSRAPFVTGNLRATHYFKKVGPFTYEVGSNAPYAVYVELGTRYMRAQPFLVPAWVAARYRMIQALGRIRLLS